MLRRSAAAPSDRLYAHFSDLFHPAGKFLRAHVINGPAALRAGQTGIGIDYDRHAADLGEPPDDRDHLLRSEAAVDAERVHPQAFQERHGGIHAAPGQELALLIKGNCDADRQAAILSGSQHSRLCLITVRHRLDQDEVRPCSAAVSHDFPEQLHCPLKRQVSQRFKEFARGSYIQRHKSVLASGPASGFLCVVHRGRHDRLEIIREFERICAESIRVENIAAGAQVSAVQVYDILRPDQVPCLRQFSSPQSFRLQDRPGTSVKDQPFLTQSLKQTFFHYYLQSF